MPSFVSSQATCSPKDHKKIKPLYFKKLQIKGVFVGFVWMQREFLKVIACAHRFLKFQLQSKIKMQDNFVPNHFSKAKHRQPLLR